MPTAKEDKSAKFARVFDELADLRERVVRVEVHEENEKKQLDEVLKKLDAVTCTLHEIIGRESVRASIYGVVGAIVSGAVVWVISLIRGN